MFGHKIRGLSNSFSQLSVGLRYPTYLDFYQSFRSGTSQFQMNTWTSSRQPYTPNSEAKELLANWAIPYAAETRP